MASPSASASNAPLPPAPALIDSSVENMASPPSASTSNAPSPSGPGSIARAVENMALPPSTSTSNAPLPPAPAFTDSSVKNMALSPSTSISNSPLPSGPAFIQSAQKRMASPSASTSNAALPPALAQLVEKGLANKIVQTSLLPALHHRTTGPNTYTLTKRVTAEQLCQRYCSDIASAQIEYIKKVENARTILFDNADCVLRMDTAFGTSCVPAIESSSSEDEVKCLKDGSRWLRCPLLPCETNTFKLRRHIRTLHPLLSDEHVDAAMEMAKLMAKNKTVPGDASVKQTIKVTRQTATSLVQRRGNYKQCILCQTLVMNMTNHIKGTHGIASSDLRYNSLVTNCKVIPKCYVSMEGKTPKLLTGQALKDAENSNASILANQETTLSNLKELRDQMQSLKEQISACDAPSEKEALEATWSEVYSLYKSERYKDRRSYSEKMKNWKDSFEAHLQLIRYSNWKRASTMACDVLIPFEETLENSLTFQDLQSDYSIREILKCFRDQPGISSSSKIKYIACLEKMLKFLYFDLDSPERTADESDSSLTTKSAKYKLVQRQLKSMLEILSKDKGAEKIQTKNKARTKLLTQEETDMMLLEASSELTKVSQAELSVVKGYTREEIFNVRNCLIAVGTLRMGRRTKELIKMTVEEALNGRERTVNGVRYHVVEVLDQKTAKSGHPAPVVFSELEYRTLILFIEHLRPQILGDPSCQVVFPSGGSFGGLRHNSELSLSAAYNILQKFTTPSGKKLSSRVARTSKVTNSRLCNISEEEKRNLAKAMNHDYAISEKHYNFEDMTDAAARAASLNLSENSELTIRSPVPSTSNYRPPATSTPVKRTRARDSSADSDTDSITFPVKKKLLSETAISSSDSQDSSILTDEEQLNATLKVLRRKKIKANDKLRRQADLKPTLVSKIEEILRKMKHQGILETLRTPKGNLTMAPIKSILTSEILESFTPSEIKIEITNALERLQ